uniref:Uncharacterized protein n=1 Tax=Meloidogyne enterolobii TaxID=390850 RepID=A0A6V7UV57_MELEN|nr:unnamed protein product [Meloidogyne enterolobii]
MFTQPFYVDHYFWTHPIKNIAKGISTILGTNDRVFKHRAR